ncbi:MAG TPA: ribosome biogenesis GTPase Der [Candidatus Hydrogenedentes bacterium]|nr:ribosome biogenesis GTPase Der [Candidatus Hydrogenedentota bacterium]HPG66673.1 ribosome biogenesis GTPase Der [Candidatus Hydrogenedentota bacterium]
MARTRDLPLVAICGRPNVGKSTLFNRITGRQRAIVHAEEGITRDRFFATAEWGGRRFRMVDTGGIVENPIDPVVQKMQEQVRFALDEACVVVFVVDGQQEITRTDHELCLELFKYGKPVVLAVNKLDNERLALNVHNFHELGMADLVAISSGHGRGMDDLMNAIVARLPEPKDVESRAEIEGPPVTKVAVIGKPNVGKSSFVNAILNEERSIVDSRPGTTRDAIDIDFEWKGRHYLLIDTAGMRRKAGITRKVEQYSVARALRSVRRADVCLVMLEAVEGITEQDKRILDYVREQGTAMVIAWSKWDLVEDKAKHFKGIDDAIDLKMPFLKYVPFMTISSLTRKRLFTVFEYIDRVAAEAEKRISTGELNRFIDKLRGESVSSTHKGKQAKVLYATQSGVKPTTFVLFVNQKRLFHFSYVRHIENQLRAEYGFEGVPIAIELREGTTERP